jgi:hypothetical protein
VRESLRKREREFEIKSLRQREVLRKRERERDRESGASWTE